MVINSKQIRYHHNDSNISRDVAIVFNYKDRMRIQEEEEQQQPQQQRQERICDNDHDPRYSIAGTCSCHATSSASFSTSWMLSILSLFLIGSTLCCIVFWNIQQKQLMRSKKMIKTYQRFRTDNVNNDNFIRDRNTSNKFIDNTLSFLTKNWQQQEQMYNQRMLATANDDDHTSNDDEKDETCSEYLVNFLNDTSNFQDECQGFLKAYEAAHCSKAEDGKELHGITLGNNTKDDDIALDDDIENLQCCHVMKTYYKKHCADQFNGSNMIDSTKLLCIVMVLVVCGFVKSLLRYAHIQFIPDAGACIIVGIMVGIAIQLLSDTSHHHEEINKLTFDNDLFLRIMLPPIIFEASLLIDKQSFRKNLFPILLFSIVGTTISAICIGYSVYYISNFVWYKGIHLPLLDSLLYGSLMSSIDPVATLSILASVGISQSDPLYILIFGESLLNDGVSIVLFDSLLEHMGDSDVVDAASFTNTVHDFLMITSCSILIGIICGIFATIYFWFLQKKSNDVTEVALFFAWALIPYYVSDGFHLSGIISIMVMGFIMDYYIIGGNQSVDTEWMEYMEMMLMRRNNSSTTFDPQQPNDFNRDTTPMAPMIRQIRIIYYKAFSGKGHLMNRSRHHVGFVAEVISNIMETAIFAYLGIFLFNENINFWNFKLMTSGLFSCVVSRAVMVLLLSSLVNLCVFIDLERTINNVCKICRKVLLDISASTNNSISSSMSRRNSSLYEDDDNDEDIVAYRYGDNNGTVNTNNPFKKHYLNAATQMILFSAGIRGAVSYALVQNIPIYDGVTKTGSHYKGELRTMTTAVIMVLLFTFGAITYFTVNGMANNSNIDEDNNMSVPLTSGMNNHEQEQQQQHSHHAYRRLESSGLISLSEHGGGGGLHNNRSSDDGASSDINSLLLEASMEERRRRPHLNTTGSNIIPSQPLDTTTTTN